MIKSVLLRRIVLLVLLTVILSAALTYGIYTVTARNTFADIKSEELMPKIIIPMHYRFKNYGTRRLEHIEALTDLFDSPELIRHYDTDTIEIDENTEPQVAILNFLG